MNASPTRPLIISPDVLRGSPDGSTPGSAAARTPPGQTLTTKWPVLHYGPVNHVDPYRPDWKLRVFGACENPFELSWEEFLALPQVDVFCDIHCVTHWSRLNNTFTGVPTKLLIDRAKPKAGATFVMCHAERGFTVNVPLNEFTKDDCLLAHQHDGKPLDADHGYPLRGIVPQLYFWKGAKWICGIELRTSDAPGFWEQNGYHMNGNPWTEERFGW
jgi:DMSO/TMAO reductase YedYZ molybdopterin-dependent catalytic subunit